MSTSRRNVDSDDFFAQTRMSLGDHIEDLRAHLIRAIVGFCVALAVSFFFGSYALEFISAPIEKQLGEYYNRRLQKRSKDHSDKAVQDPEASKGVIKFLRQDLENIFRRPIEEGPWLTEDKKYVLVTTQLDPKADSEKWAEMLKEIGPRPSLKSFTIMEAALVWFKVCVIIGVVLGSPWIFYQIWAFIAAGLYPQEKRLVNHYLPFSVVLFLAGVALCQFVVMPQTIAGLLAFNEWLGIEPELRLNDWLNFALIMPLLFGIAFQMPLAMLTLERIGLMTVESYQQRRRIVLFLLAVAYVIVSPTPDPWTMILFWVPMVGLYELGIWLCKWAPRNRGEEFELSESEEMVEV